MAGLVAAMLVAVGVGLGFALEALSVPFPATLAILPVAAGLIVARVGEEDIGEQLATQLFSVPRALGLTAAVIGVLGIVPGMPHLPFLLLAALCGAALIFSARR